MGWEDGFHFGLSDESRAIIDVARDFATRRVLPQAGRIDREHSFPAEFVAEMGKLGFMGMCCPEEYGGTASPVSTYCQVIEELAAACASTSIIMSAHNSLCMSPIVSFGTEEQKRRYLPPLAAGTALGCFALSEPGVGSDAASITCSVKREGESFVVTGAKNWITNGPEAHTVVLFAMQDSSRGSQGVTAFVHDLSIPGVVRGKREDKLGIRGSPTCGVSYDGVKLGNEHLLGREGEGFKIAMHTLNGGRLGVAAQAVGIARAALRDALAYSKERHTFGRPIAQHQLIQGYLAEMITRIDAARLLTLSAATRKDRGEPYIREAAMAKLFASETAHYCADRCVQIHGGYGYVTDYPAERHLRDARITEIYEGTSEIQRLVITGQLLKESEGSR